MSSNELTSSDSENTTISITNVTSAPTKTKSSCDWKGSILLTFLAGCGVAIYVFRSYWWALFDFTSDQNNGPYPTPLPTFSPESSQPFNFTAEIIKSRLDSPSKQIPEASPPFDSSALATLQSSNIYPTDQSAATPGLIEEPEIEESCEFWYVFTRDFRLMIGAWCYDFGKDYKSFYSFDFLDEWS
jgi:hypothetical protein